MTRAALLLLSALLCTAAQAHPLAPALLQIDEMQPQVYAVQWRTSATRAGNVDVTPQFPPDCVRQAAAAPQLEDNEAYAVRWQLRCAQPLAGRDIAIAGLELSRINVILRVQLLGAAPLEQLLDAQQAQVQLPLAGSARPVASGYFSLGVTHLLSGPDHLLFVAGLFLLLRRVRALILAVSMFTLGHSVTLSLAALGLVHVQQAWAELGIALTILVLAVHLARPDDAPRNWIARWPWAMAALFGLLHGLGFAGALSDIGLPPDSIPLALLSFNVGIECGQLLWLAGLAAIAALLRRALPLPAAAAIVPAYAIGALAALWCFERAALLP